MRSIGKRASDPDVSVTWILSRLRKSAPRPFLPRSFGARRPRHSVATRARYRATSAVETPSARRDARGMRTDAELGPVDDLADAAPPSRRRRCSHSENDQSSSLLCRLPHDLAARVLATLPPSARARCAAVSRGWRDLFRDLPQQQLWRELDFTRDDRKVRALTPPARLRYRVSGRFFRAPPSRISPRADAPSPRR